MIFNLLQKAAKWLLFKFKTEIYQDGKDINGLKERISMVYLPNKK
jgi:hypothetical protein